MTILGIVLKINILYNKLYKILITSLVKNYYK